MALDPVKRAIREIRYWQRKLEKAQLAQQQNTCATCGTGGTGAKESEKEEREKIPPHPSKEREEEKDKESTHDIRARARELVFPKHATVLDIPPDDILVEPQPEQIIRDKPPNFFDLFCWVRKHIRVSHKRDVDIVAWWNAKIDDGWLDMQGNPLRNWPCHLRVWLKQRAIEHNAEKQKARHQSSNANNINDGLRLRGGTLSPKILEKLKELENGIE